MGRLERTIEKNCVRILEDNGYRVLKCGNQGWPDRLVVGLGHCFWVEFKTPTGSLTPAQERRIPKLREMHQAILIISSEAQLRKELQLGPA